jgi:hypothetical protein
VYRGHRVEIRARAIDGAWHVEIRVRRVLSEAKPLVFTLMFPLIVQDAERRGMLLGKNWVDRHAE